MRLFFLEIAKWSHNFIITLNNPFIFIIHCTFHRTPPPPPFFNKKRIELQPCPKVCLCAFDSHEISHQCACHFHNIYCLIAFCDRNDISNIYGKKQDNLMITDTYIIHIMCIQNINKYFPHVHNLTK